MIQQFVTKADLALGEASRFFILEYKSIIDNYLNIINETNDTTTQALVGALRAIKSLYVNGNAVGAYTTNEPIGVNDILYFVKETLTGNITINGIQLKDTFGSNIDATNLLEDAIYIVTYVGANLTLTSIKKIDNQYIIDAGLPIKTSNVLIDNKLLISSSVLNLPTGLFEVSNVTLPYTIGGFVITSNNEVVKFTINRNATSTNCLLSSNDVVTVTLERDADMYRFNNIMSVHIKYLRHPTSATSTILGIPTIPTPIAVNTRHAIKYAKSVMGTTAETFTGISDTISTGEVPFFHEQAEGYFSNLMIGDGLNRSRLLYDDAPNSSYNFKLCTFTSPATNSNEYWHKPTVDALVGTYNIAYEDLSKLSALLTTLDTVVGTKSVSSKRKKIGDESTALSVETPTSNSHIANIDYGTGFVVKPTVITYDTNLTDENTVDLDTNRKISFTNTTPFIESSSAVTKFHAKTLLSKNTLWYYDVMAQTAVDSSNTSSKLLTYGTNNINSGVSGTKQNAHTPALHYDGVYNNVSRHTRFNDLHFHTKTMYGVYQNRTPFNRGATHGSKDNRVYLKMKTEFGGPSVIPKRKTTSIPKYYIANSAGFLAVFDGKVFSSSEGVVRPRVVLVSSYIRTGATANSATINTISTHDLTSNKGGTGEVYGFHTPLSTTANTFSNMNATSAELINVNAYHDIKNIYVTHTGADVFALAILETDATTSVLWYGNSGGRLGPTSTTSVNWFKSTFKIFDRSGGYDLGMDSSQIAVYERATDIFKIMGGTLNQFTSIPAITAITTLDPLVKLSFHSDKTVVVTNSKIYLIENISGVTAPTITDASTVTVATIPVLKVTETPNSLFLVKTNGIGGHLLIFNSPSETSSGVYLWGNNISGVGTYSIYPFQGRESYFDSRSLKAIDALYDREYIFILCEDGSVHYKCADIASYGNFTATSYWTQFPLPAKAKRFLVDARGYSNGTCIIETEDSEQYSLFNNVNLEKYGGTNYSTAGTAIPLNFGQHLDLADANTASARREISKYT